MFLLQSTLFLVPMILSFLANTSNASSLKDNPTYQQLWDTLWFSPGVGVAKAPTLFALFFEVLNVPQLLLPAFPSFLQFQLHDEARLKLSTVPADKNKKTQ